MAASGQSPTATRPAEDSVWKPPVRQRNTPPKQADHATMSSTAIRVYQKNQPSRLPAGSADNTRADDSGDQSPPFGRVGDAHGMGVA